MGGVNYANHSQSETVWNSLTSGIRTFRHHIHSAVFQQRLTADSEQTRCRTKSPNRYNSPHYRITNNANDDGPGVDGGQSTELRNSRGGKG